MDIEPIGRLEIALGRIPPFVHKFCYVVFTGLGIGIGCQLGTFFCQGKLVRRRHIHLLHLQIIGRSPDNGIAGGAILAVYEASVLVGLRLSCSVRRIYKLMYAACRRIVGIYVRHTVHIAYERNDFCLPPIDIHVVYRKVTDVLPLRGDTYVPSVITHRIDANTVFGNYKAVQDIAQPDHLLDRAVLRGPYAHLLVAGRRQYCKV